MYGVVLAFYILVCIILLVVVLLQQRGGGLASVFGGGAEAIFGGGGAAPFMIKLTAGLAGLFMALSVILVLMSRPTAKKGIVEEKARELQREMAPETPFAPLEEALPESVGE
jgi:preprotein translocase subunit SecG